MSLIDQRILVIAPSEAVWLYLTEPAHISKWNRGAKQLSLLTTRASGVGARRRCIDGRGRAVVEEMTAWLDNIGYEYTVVDGPYRAFKGRLRLQPVPEGTQVFWTIEYSLRGPLGGLRNAIGYQRGLRSQVADSLRALRRLIEASGIRLDPDKQARVAMKADPGIAVRAARMAEPTRSSLVSSPVQVISGDDLPDMPTLPPIAQPTAIPSFAPVAFNTTASLTTQPPSKLLTEETKPRPPVGLREQLSEPTFLRNSTAADQTLEAPTAEVYTSPTVPASLVAPPRPPDPPTQTVAPAVRQPDMPKDAALPIRDFDEPTLNTAPPLPPDDIRATGEMSIWDVFGMDRPSQRNKADLDAVIASLQTPPPMPAARMNALPGVTPPAQPIVESAAPASPPKIAKAHGKATVKVRRLSVPSRQRAQVKVRRLILK